MRSKVIALAATTMLGAAALAAPAIAGASSMPSTTVQGQLPPGYTFGCSATAFGPSFTQTGSLGGTMTYMGGTSCGGTGATSVYKSVSIYAQVENGSQWFTITGSGISSGVPWRGNPVRVQTGHPFVNNHTYRIVAKASDEVPDGYAGCSLKGHWGCYKQVTITAVGDAFLGD
jgi:hypothetical protein